MASPAFWPAPLSSSKRKEWSASWTSWPGANCQTAENADHSPERFGAMADRSPPEGRKLSDIGLPTRPTFKTPFFMKFPRTRPGDRRQKPIVCPTSHLLARMHYLVRHFHHRLHRLHV